MSDQVEKVLVHYEKKIKELEAFKKEALELIQGSLDNHYTNYKSFKEFLSKHKGQE